MESSEIGDRIERVSEAIEDGRRGAGCIGLYQLLYRVIAFVESGGKRFFADLQLLTNSN